MTCICMTSGNGSEGCGLCNETGARMTQAPTPAVRAMDVTEAAMVAALEVFREGETITPDHQEAIALGLLRAAARWWVMTTPDIADEGARNGFALCLKQERINQTEPKETVQ